MNKITVVGAGLAGVEAAWQAAEAGVAVELCEMKPEKRSPAHRSDGFAELVCSNSLKASRLESAAGLLKAEMREFGSLCMQAADQCAVAAGGALAVDRDRFSQFITEKITAHPLITVRHGEYVTDLITNRALEFIDELAGEGNPFYLSVHYTAPHSPWDAEHHPKRLIEKYDKCTFDEIPDLPDHPDSTVSDGTTPQEPSLLQVSTSCSCSPRPPCW